MVSTAETIRMCFLRIFIAGKLLSLAMLKAMMTFIPASDPCLETQTGSGLGLMRFEVHGQELMGHVAELMGFSSIAM